MYTATLQVGGSVIKRKFSLLSVKNSVYMCILANDSLKLGSLSSVN